MKYYFDLCNHMQKDTIKYFLENYKDLIKIFDDFDKRLIGEKKYLLEDNYFDEYFPMDLRFGLAMSIRSLYIYDKNTKITTGEAENISWHILIGFIVYLNNSFKIFEN